MHYQPGSEHSLPHFVQGLVHVQEPAQYARLHAILWNHATGLMEAQQFERALNFYSACLAVALEPERRVQALHAQALCCTNLRSFDR